jgi:hypothetical protein
MHAQRFRRRPLHVRTRLKVERSAQEIALRGVADIELDGWVELFNCTRSGLRKLPVSMGGLSLQRFVAQFGHRLERRDVEKLPRSIERPAFVNHAADCPPVTAFASSRWN